MATLYVDGVPYEVEEGQSLLAACLSLGFDVPYFCWHPALGSVWACRQCAVKEFKDQKDKKGRIIMSCMTPVSDGARISIDDPEVKAFRASVLEWLMMNHPHDCPVCDEGGECHLQDMTVMTGHVARRYRFPKRTYRNQDLGPFLNHEMNRCIHCYRCVRFYRDFAGGRDLAAFGIHDHVYFGRHRDGPLESEFSGNLVEVCPTGVFTDKTFKNHYSRSWDLQSAPSVCAHCGVGCNTFASERFGELRRIRNRYHHELNRYFLCDRGRFGYEFVSSPTRIRTPMAAGERGAGAAPAGREQILRRLAGFLSKPGRIVGVGSPRASLEANFALRTLVGPDRFCPGFAPAEAELTSSILNILTTGPARSASLKDLREADAVLVLAENVSETAPLAALALRERIPAEAARRAVRLNVPRWNDAAFRQVLQDEKAILYVATTGASRLDDLATRSVKLAPDDVARLGFAVAHFLSARAPAPDRLDEQLGSLAREIASSLDGSERPVVLSGTSQGRSGAIEAAANVAWALCEKGRSAGLHFVLPEWNSFGAAMIGGLGIDEIAGLVEKGQADTLIVLENDLFLRLDQARAEALLNGVATVVVLDSVQTRTTSRADFVLPAATFAECSGTVVNSEGRAQRFYQVFKPPEEIQAGWRWIRDLLEAAGRPEAASWGDLDAVDVAMARAIPSLAGVLEIAPPAEYRAVGMRIPRQPHRWSGRTAVNAHQSVHEPRPPVDPDAPFAFSMEGYEGIPPPPLQARYWAPGWNSVQALNRFQQKVGGTLQGGDPGKRLVEPNSQARPEYFRRIPPAFEVEPGRVLVVHRAQVFGSDELSSLAPAVASRSPGSHLALNPDDASSLGLREGAEARISMPGAVWELPVRIDGALPRSVVGLHLGPQNLSILGFPAWGTLEAGRPR